ncbi:hypothetical protein [Embleya sp. NPDC059237]|uniref:hypothetical protein n=1 Tax=Embleya sp. NPDC059237 TaxID=3346784 RepID=UPI0036A1AEAD
MTNPDPAPSPPDPAPGSRAVTDRLGVTPRELYRRHRDAPGALFELADLVIDAAREVDRCTADLVRVARGVGESVTRSADRILDGRRFDTGILQYSATHLDLAAGRHALVTAHLTTLIDAYARAVNEPAPDPPTPARGS